MWNDLMLWLGPDFYWVPYCVIVWLIATPLVAYVLCRAGGKDDRNRFK